MLLQLAVRRGDLFGHPLRFVHLLEQSGNALFNLLETLRAILVAGHFVTEIVEALQGSVGLLAHLLERFAGLRELGRAAGHLRQHGAEHGPFFPGLSDQGLELVLLIPVLPLGAEKCVKHGGEYSAGPAVWTWRVAQNLPCLRIRSLLFSATRARNYAVSDQISARFLFADRGSPLAPPRPCLPLSRAPRSWASMRAGCTWKSTSAGEFPTSSSSVCRMPACVRAAIASARRSLTRGSTSPSIGSLLISPPATSGRPAPRLTCPSPSACSPPPASSPAPTSPASSTSASSRSTAQFSPRAACCRLPPKPAGPGAKALLLPYDNLAEAEVVSGLRLLPGSRR